MNLPRIGKKYLRVTVAATLADGAAATLSGVDAALLAPRATPTPTTTWKETTYANGVATVLVAGPDADPGGALVVPVAGADLWIRVVDTPEVDAVLVERITVE